MECETYALYGDRGAVVKDQFIRVGVRNALPEEGGIVDAGLDQHGLRSREFLRLLALFAGRDGRESRQSDE